MSEHGGFFTVTVGQGSNKAYALGLCREDLTSYVCHSCVKFAVDDLRARCPNQKEEISWSSDPQCILHYANRHFFKMLKLYPTTFFHNNRNITSNLPQFDTVWESLMESVVTKASNGSSTLKYKQGARIQNPNYWLGWDLHRFYVPNPATTAPSLSPPLAPGTPLTITKEDKEDTQEVQLLDLVQGSVPHKNLNGDFNLENVGRSLDFPSIHLDILQTATNNFCDENKLG
ncbi:hypothetical protein Godav_025709 [Gossypium davidsonii]|uniref:Gnk2-homologous domain-containing protein n=1 Tax=Gossypium davidsonii TaxID=34287 RepID=A0A7J8T8D4_GOSDV|nr:hypothetical protein [Gossypium davidsonii]